jgi:predicted RNA-binding protein with PUA-like domain
MSYWLVKSEPDEFSIDDLARKRVEPWTGVRSMFARYQLRRMAVGDDVLFYHSSCSPPGVVGLARVVRTGVVDETQFDPKSDYYDPASTREAPRWDTVDVEYVATLPNMVPLDRIRAAAALADMVLLRQSRLSVQPVTEAEYRHIVALADTAWVPPPKPKKPAAKKPAAKKPAAKKPAAKKPAPKPTKKPATKRR